MKRERTKKHPKYYALPAYQMLSRLTDKQVADHLGICVRTYKDKTNGYSDFTQAEGQMLSVLFGRSKDDIFLT